MQRSDLALLAVFEAVARKGGFRAAAGDLGLSPAATSEAVSRLEAAVGTRLLARTTRSVAPTPAGALLLRRLSGSLRDIAAAMEEASLEGGRVSGVLRLAAARSTATLALAPLLPGFLAAHPGVEVEVDVDEQLIDIVARGLDAGLRFGEALDADMTSVPIGTPQRGVVVGSPDYFQGRPVPLSPADLANHVCLGRRMPSGALYAWEFERDGRAVTAAPRGPLVASDDALLLDAARAGVGLAWCFEAMAARDLAEGRLVNVLADWLPPFDELRLYYPGRAGVRPVLRAFIDYALASRREMSAR